MKIEDVHNGRGFWERTENGYRCPVCSKDFPKNTIDFSGHYTECNMAELKKCEDDPVYFFNRYIKRPDSPDLSREQWEKFNRLTVLARNGHAMLKRRNPFINHVTRIVDSEYFKRNDNE